jgi:hypothetical protein
VSSYEVKVSKFSLLRILTTTNWIKISYLLTENPPKFGVKNPRDGFLKNIFSLYEKDFHCIIIRMEIIQYLRIRLKIMQ